MAEIRRGSETGVSGDRLPWLEPVEDEDDYYAPEQPVSYRGVVIAGLLVLAGIVALTAGILWYRHHAKAVADAGQIIRADGPYKVKPTDPGGMQADSSAEVAYGTSAGQDIDSPIDLTAMPEQPIDRTKPRPAPQAAPQAPAPQPMPQATAAPVATQALAPPAAPVARAPAKPLAPPVAPTPKPAPATRVAETPLAPPSAAGGSGTIQLGAFSTSAKASAAWKSLSGRFAFLRDLTMVVSPVESGDKTLYRLRAGGAANAARLCAQMRVAGETCSVVG